MLPIFYNSDFDHFQLRKCLKTRHYSSALPAWWQISWHQCNQGLQGLTKSQLSHLQVKNLIVTMTNFYQVPHLHLLHMDLHLAIHHCLYHQDHRWEIRHQSRHFFPKKSVSTFIAKRKNRHYKKKMYASRQKLKIVSTCS